MQVSVNGRKVNYKYKVGVALSGGGIRGIAHVGVLKVLLDNHIPIDMISGTSAGAIVAAMYACGYSPRQIQKILEELKMNELIDLNVTVGDLFKHSIKWLFNGLFRFWSVLPKGLIKGDKIEKYFYNLWQDRKLKDTNIPLAITSVDINTGDTIFFTTPVYNRSILNARYYHNATITDAVRASISIPGIFFPKKYHNMTLVDGAVKNNLPTDILKHMGADIIIAVDLGYDGQPNNDIHSVSEILVQCIDIMGREVTLLKAEQYADIIIRPEFINVSMKNMKQALEGIDYGEKAAKEKLYEIKKLL